MSLSKLFLDIILSKIYILSSDSCEWELHKIIRVKSYIQAGKTETHQHFDHLPVKRFIHNTSSKRYIITYCTSPFHMGYVIYFHGSNNIIKPEANKMSRFNEFFTWNCESSKFYNGTFQRPLRCSLIKLLIFWLQILFR